MALVSSSLSKVCRSIADFVSAELNAIETVAYVSLGNPGDAVPAETEGQRLNLFFFRFEPFSFDADVMPGETWRLRMHCMITPFGVLEESVSAGENDLRLVGEVLRLFHENPVFKLTVMAEDFHIQVIPQNLGLDQINQLWSTQGDLAYRPSLLYEVSLAPVIPNNKTVEAPLVGSVGMGVRAKMDALTGSSSAQAPHLRPIIVNTLKEDWAPAICLVRNGVCVQSLSFAIDDPSVFNPFQAWVAGLPTAPVELHWDVWDATNGWQEFDVITPAIASTQFIDPARVDAATTVAINLPMSSVGQMALYASRNYMRASDGALLSVRSNPILVSLYEVTP